MCYIGNERFGCFFHSVDKCLHYSIKYEMLVVFESIVALMFFKNEVADIVNAPLIDL